MKRPSRPGTLWIPRLFQQARYDPSRFLPPLLDAHYYDEARGIDESEARRTARRLARDEGIFAGISTGMNVAGALHLARELGPGHVVATVAVDTGLKYLAGDLFEVP